MEMEMEMELFHFSHQHRLLLKNNTMERDRERANVLPCKACDAAIFPESKYYGCEYESCFFKIHISCAKFPREIQNHPFHPKHKLTLNTESALNYATTPLCNVCGDRCEKFNFHCSESDCKFDIDLLCAAMMPIKSQLIRRRHPHPLLICNNNNNNNNTTTSSYSYKCRCCCLPIITKAPVVVCLECPALMHESCSELPQEMLQHILHPQHPLILILTRNLNDVIRCDACGLITLGFYYYCEQCDFVLDISCASLTPTSTSLDVTTTITIHSHPHPLIECFSKNKKSLPPLVCAGCNELFEDEESIYVCLSCPKLLHKLCAHAPRQMDHPFHLEHPLRLVDDTTNDTRLLWKNCQVCMERFTELTCHFYRCCDCGFHYHSNCALPVPPFINSQALLHQHPLAFLDIKGGNLPCNACRQSCYYPFFRCVGCNFNLHVHCLSSGLPPTVKHKCHLHPLTLTHSPIKDHEDENENAEFYCDACEEHRQLNETTYYCVECHYVAHVHCVLSEVFPYLEREFASLGDKLDKMKLDIALDAVEDIEGLELHRDEQEEKMEVLEGAFIGARTEDDLVNDRADDSSVEVVKEPVDTAGEALLADDSSVEAVKELVDTAGDALLADDSSVEAVKELVDTAGEALLADDSSVEAVKELVDTTNEALLADDSSVEAVKELVDTASKALLADDSSVEVVKELVDTTGEALLAELDAEIFLFLLNELDSEIVEQKIKLDQLQERCAHYMLSLQK